LLQYCLQWKGNKKHQVKIVIYSNKFITTYFRFEIRNYAQFSPQCHPAVVNAMPLRIRKICAALASGILDYPDDPLPTNLVKGNETPLGLAFFYC